MKVLITGGTGLIGRRLTELLHTKGYEVAYLSRSHKPGKIKHFLWDLNKNYIEDAAINYPDYIINLAGANVFEKKWTKEFKKEIIESRTNSVNILYQKFRESGRSLKAFISASAIGYYGADTGSDLISEEHAEGNDFLATVVSQWEKSIMQFEGLGIRTVRLRIGIVLDKNGGALDKLVTPIKLGAGAALGSGKQYVSWIHIDDLCHMFVDAIEKNSMKGIYNAVAPNPVTNEELTKGIASAIGRSIYLPNVPSMALKFMLGSEKATILLGGNYVSPEKIIKEGFNFKYTHLEQALKDLL